MSNGDGDEKSGHNITRKLVHEMRTPLGQIIGYAEMVEEELRDRGQPDLIDDLSRIRSAARGLLALVGRTFTPEWQPTGDPESRAASDLAFESDASSNRAGRLLLVDDDPMNRDLLGRRLQREGYGIEAVSDGAEALRRIEAETFDLILLDVLMPGMSGLEVLREIRRTHRIGQLPVIMVTALGDSEDVVEALHLGANDHVSKPIDFPVAFARIETHLSLVRATREIEDLAQQLEIRNTFVRRTFGRYVSDEIVTNLLEHEEGFEIRGEKRVVTIMMADLRGFSSLTEALQATDIVYILNNYLGTMSEIIQFHRGTVDEFIGDGILAFFGAPVACDDHATQAVACALKMQLAVEGVNRKNRERGLPEIEMGIGISTGEVIVGNIGSEKRAKYGAVGSSVNLASRIESFTLGGEILISETTREDVGHLDVSHSRDVIPKGFEAPLRVYNVAGLGGAYDLALLHKRHPMRPLTHELSVRLCVLDGKQASGDFFPGSLLASSPNAAMLRSDRTLAGLSDLRIELVESEGVVLPGVSYARVIEVSADDGLCHLRFSVRAPSLVERLDLHAGPE